MKLFVVVSAILVVARGGVIAPIAAPAVAFAPVVAVPVAQHSSQYHTQDAAGQYAYGYANDLSAKNEIRSADGQTVGSYSYLDADGKIQNVQYRSDAIHGFRVSATNLPVAPSAAEVAPLVRPEPVQDTPEVVEAKTRHLEAFRQAKEQVKKSLESAAVEVKTAIQAHPAIISETAPGAIVRSDPAIELFRSAPILAAPSFGYSFGINYGGLYAINSYALHPQAFVTAYAAPGALLSAPVAAEAASFKAKDVQQAVPQAPSDLPEVVEARAKPVAEVEGVTKDIEKEQSKE